MLPPVPSSPTSDDDDDDDGGVCEEGRGLTPKDVFAS